MATIAATVGAIWVRASVMNAKSIGPGTAIKKTKKDQYPHCEPEQMVHSDVGVDCCQLLVLSVLRIGIGSHQPVGERRMFLFLFF